MAVMAIFIYTAGVLATTLFGGTHPQWFGSLGKSLYSLFQIMTLESWSMGIVRPVMEQHPQAWAFFVPFIILATFTILNLFIGIIVSTMQELATLPDPRRRRGPPATGPPSTSNTARSVMGPTAGATPPIRLRRSSAGRSSRRLPTGSCCGPRRTDGPARRWPRLRGTRVAH
jgi:voltage-gated sodium channel